MSSNPFDFDRGGRRPARKRRRFDWSWLTTLLIVAGVLGGVALLVIVLDRWDNPVPPSADPYKADCAAVRAYLRSRYDGEIEILSWGHRTVFQSQALGDTAVLKARFRVKGFREQSGSFHIHAGGQIAYAVID
jgi:hypothetical protein